MNLYVIKDTEKNRFKIGIAKHVGQRLSALQTGSSTRLEIVYEIPILIGASQIENKLHKHFRTNRLHGEWFKLSLEEVQAIPKLAIDYSIFGKRGRLPDNWQSLVPCLKHSQINCSWCANA